MIAPRINVDRLLQFNRLRDYLNSSITNLHSFKHDFIPFVRSIDFSCSMQHMAQVNDGGEYIDEGISPPLQSGNAVRLQRNQQQWAMHMGHSSHHHSRRHHYHYEPQRAHQINRLLRREILTSDTHRVWMSMTNRTTGEKRPIHLKHKQSLTDNPTSAVLLLLFFRDGQVRTVVLRKTRLNKSKNRAYMHSLQASLPGGFREQGGQEALDHCALRETKEEVGVDAQIINDTIPCIHTLAIPKSTCVQPFIGTADDLSGMAIQEDEVAQLFDLPLVDIVDNFDPSGVYLARRLSDTDVVEYNGFVYSLVDQLPTFESQTDITEDLAALGDRPTDLRIWGMTARLLTFIFCRMELALEEKELKSKM